MQNENAEQNVVTNAEPDAEALRRQLAELRDALATEQGTSKRHAACAEAAERRLDELVTVDAELSEQLKDASQRIVAMERRLDQQREYWRQERARWQSELEAVQARAEKEAERADAAERGFRAFMFQVLSVFPSRALAFVLERRKQKEQGDVRDAHAEWR